MSKYDGYYAFRKEKGFYDLYDSYRLEVKFDKNLQTEVYWAIALGSGKVVGHFQINNDFSNYILVNSKLLKLVFE